MRQVEGVRLVDVLPVVIAGRARGRAVAPGRRACPWWSPAGPVVLAMFQVEGVGLHAVELVHLVDVLPVVIAGRAGGAGHAPGRGRGRAGACSRLAARGDRGPVRLVEPLCLVEGVHPVELLCLVAGCGPVVLAMRQVEGITRHAVGVATRPHPCAACRGGLPMRTSWRAVLAGRSRGCMPLPWCCAPGAQAATR